MGFFSKIKKTLGISDNDDDKNNNNNIRNPFIDSQAIESLSLACIKLDENLGLKSTGRCGICVKSINSESFKQMKEYIDNLLKVVIDKKNINFDITFNSIIDNYGY